MNCIRSTYGIVLTLHDFLLQEYGDSMEISEDEPRFLKFLSSTMVCSESSEILKEDEKTSLCGYFEDTNCSISSVLEWTIQKLISKNNVLSNGFRARRFFDSGMQQMNVECFLPNSLVNQLKTAEWEKLLSILGTRVVCRLFLGFSLFSRLANGCYLQLTGKPMHEIRSSNPSKTKKMIEKKQVLYCNRFLKQAGLPSKHILRTMQAVPSVDAAARILLRHVFSVKKLTRRLLQAEAIFQSMILKFGQFQFGRKLNLHCPIKLKSARRDKQPAKTGHSIGRARSDTLLAWHLYESGYESQDDTVHALTTARMFSTKNVNKDQGVRNSKYHVKLNFDKHDEENDSGNDNDSNDSDDNNKNDSFGISSCLPGIISGKSSVSSNERSCLFSLEELLQMNSTCCQIFNFIREVCIGIFPRELWGSKYNENLFLEKVNLFIKLRRYESVSCSELIEGMKFSHFQWLSSASTLESPSLQNTNVKEEMEMNYDYNDEAVDGDEIIDNRTDKKRKRRKGGDGEDRLKRELLEKLVFWIFNDILVPLIRVHFYASERENKSTVVSYFRKPVWSWIRRKACQECLPQFEPITAPEVDTGKEHNSLKPRLDVANVRLLPKQSTVRAITNLSKRRKEVKDVHKDVNLNKRVRRKRVLQVDKPNLGVDTVPEAATANPPYLPSTNMALTALHHVLKSEIQSQKEAMGFTVMGFDDIFDNVVEYIQAQSMRSGEVSSLSFLSCDLSQCYDRIDQHRLFDIVTKLFKHDCYLIQKMSVMTCSSPTANDMNPLNSTKHPKKENTKSRSDKSTSDSSMTVRVRHIRKVTTPGTMKPLWERTSSVIATNHKAVLVEASLPSLVKREQLIELLRCHIFEHTVKLSSRGTQLFHQAQGIAQGSILSSLLCNIYMGHFEQTLCSSFKHSSNLIMRMMDDYVFISNKEGEAKKFYDTLKHAENELSYFKLNEDKTVTNLSDFDQEGNGDSLIVCKILDSNETDWFPWCGVEFNMQSMQVRPNTIKFWKVCPFDSLTVARQNATHVFSEKVKSYMAIKCHPIIFDATINSIELTYRNIFALSLLGASKGIAHLRCLPNLASCDVDYLFQACHGASSYIHQLIARQVKKRQHQVELASMRQIFECGVQKEYVVWLGLFSFLLMIDRSPHSALAGLRLRLLQEIERPCYSAARLALQDIATNEAEITFRLVDEWKVTQTIQRTT